MLQKYCANRQLCLQHFCGYILVLTLLPMLFAGCRTAILSHDLFSETELNHSKNSSDSKLEPRTIPFELIFVRFGEHDSLMTSTLWDFTDEQMLHNDVRQRLQANGVRAGVVSSVLPPELMQRFVPPFDPALEIVTTQSLVEVPPVVRRTLRLLPGRENEVVSSSSNEELILLEKIDGTVKGATYFDASATFVLRAWPAANGKVRIQICPVIKHGPTERKWVGDEGVFRLEAGQKQHDLEHLLFEATLSPESILLISCSGDESSTVGDAFFRDNVSGAGVRLIALRPLHHVPDPIFTENQ